MALARGDRVISVVSLAPPYRFWNDGTGDPRPTSARRGVVLSGGAEDLILDQPGSREDDGGIGLHADVVVQGDEAYIFYFTHPGRNGALNQEGQEQRYESRRSSIQAAKLEVENGVLVCRRDEPFELKLLPEE